MLPCNPCVGPGSTAQTFSRFGVPRRVAQCVSKRFRGFGLPSLHEQDSAEVRRAGRVPRRDAEGPAERSRRIIQLSESLMQKTQRVVITSQCIRLAVRGFWYMNRLRLSGLA